MTDEWNSGERTGRGETPEKEGKAMKAIGYAAGMYVDQKGDVIDTGKQVEKIREYAEKNGIEIAAVYEDLNESEFVLERPGIRKMLLEETEAEMVLVDRVWCMGRTRAAVEELLELLDVNGMCLHTVEYCFDVTSQFVRFWYGTPGTKAYEISRKARKLEAGAPAPEKKAKV